MDNSNTFHLAHITCSPQARCTRFVELQQIFSLNPLLAKIPAKNHFNPLFRFFGDLKNGLFSSF